MSLFKLYFVVSFSYTIILFVLFHHRIAREMADQYYKRTGIPATDKYINIIMHIYYLIQALLGTFSFLIDLIHFFTDYKTCMWLRWYYEDKGDND